MHRRRVGGSLQSDLRGLIYSVFPISLSCENIIDAKPDGTASLCTTDYRTAMGGASIYPNPGDHSINHWNVYNRDDDSKLAGIRCVKDAL